MCRSISVKNKLYHIHISRREFGQQINNDRDLSEYFDVYNIISEKMSLKIGITQAVMLATSTVSTIFLMVFVCYRNYQLKFDRNLRYKKVTNCYVDWCLWLFETSKAKVN